MAEGEEEPKHPYVTVQNAKIHLIFSIVIAALSGIQLILGIVITELEIEEMVGRQEKPSYMTSRFDNWFYGDHVWVGCTGVILAVLGYSVYRTRSRSNGVILSVMCFLSGLIIYPIAIGLGGGLEVYEPIFATGLTDLRIGSAVFTGVQMLTVIAWAFYSALHTCCNPKVRTQTRLNIQAGGQATPQPQVVYVTQGAGGAVQYPGAGAVQYVGGPPQYVQQAPVPVQVHHGNPPPKPQDSSPPAYTE